MDDSYEVSSGETNVVLNVLENDSFGVDGPGAVDLIISQGPQNGTLTVDDNGTAENPSDDTLVYSPNSDFSGAELIVYQLEDATGSTATANVEVNVLPVISSFSVDNTSNPKELAFTWAASGLSGVDHFALLENPDGASGFTVVEGFESMDPSLNSAVIVKALHLTDWDNAQYRLEARASDGSPFVSAELLLSAMTTEGLYDHPSVDPVGLFKASNILVGNRFGERVALSGDGNTLVVAAPYEDNSMPGIDGDQTPGEYVVQSGAVYVYTKKGREWGLDAYIKASSLGVADYFGDSLAVSYDGTTIAVGSPKEDNHEGSEPSSQDTDSGAVYVFAKANNKWGQQTYLKARSFGKSDEFGSSVSISNDGNLLIVGAPSEDGGSTGVNGDESNNDQVNSGAAYLFSRSSQEWAQTAYLKASNTEAGDLFGTAVAISGDGLTVAIGAPNEGGDSKRVGGDQSEGSAEIDSSGAVYYFRFDGASWFQQAYIKASNTGHQDLFGSSIALSDDGSVMAVGAIQEASSSEGVNGDQANDDHPNRGAVYVLVYSLDNWSYTYLKNDNEDEQYFGSDVALSADGTILAVGSQNDTNTAVGVNGDGVATSDINGGASYVFTRAMGVWEQVSYVRSPVPRSSSPEHCGESLDLSSDGQTLAMGCWGQSSRHSAEVQTVANEVEGGYRQNSGGVFLY